ncbi:MAG: hypothetical protein ABIS01_02325 [Ferruginibacter sp.]
MKNPNFSIIALPVAILLTVQFACNSTKNNQKASSDNGEELVFQSGFEGDCHVIPFGAQIDKIVGKDENFSRKNDWISDLDSSTRYKNIYLNYTGGDSSKRFAKIIPEPGNPSNNVLWYWLNGSWVADGNAIKSRVQLEFYNIKNPYKEFYQSVRVFLTEDFNALKTYPARIPWCTLSEFWNNEWWVKGEPYGFRVTLGIGKPSAASSDLNFILNGEDPGQKEVWNGDNTNIKVPIAKWFTMEYYFKEGNKETGRFWMAITPEGGTKQVVFDIHNFTHNTKDPSPGGLSGYNPMKLYTSKDYVAYVKSKGKTLQVYWDDFKLWTNKKPAE